MNPAPTFRNRVERLELLERFSSIYPSAIISPNLAQNSPMAL